MRASPESANWRATAIRVASAFFGIALAISLLPLFERPAPPGQLPGYMTTVGLDAHGPFRFFAALIVLPIVAAWAARPLIRMLTTPQVQRWTLNLLLGSTLVSLWIASFVHDWRWVVLPVAIAAPAAVLLRNVEAGFNRHDAILIGALYPFYYSLLDLVPGVPGVALLVGAAAALLALRLGLAMWRGREALPPALCFALSPLGIVFQTVLSGQRSRHSPWLPLLFVLVTPVILSYALRDSRTNVRRVLRAIAFVIYPLAAFAHPLAASAWTAEGKQRVNVFEVSHSLVPASEMLRGEKPYRDIVPGHGLLEDGLLDFLALRMRGANVGDALKAHSLAGNLTSVAIYALGSAATGSADAGFLSLLLARALIPSGTMFLRAAPALFSLALTLSAVRRRRKFLLVWAAAIAAFGIFLAIEFALYALATVAIAAFRIHSDRRERLRALGLAAGGAAGVFLIGMVALAKAGVAGDFLRVTLFEVLSLGPVYSIGFFTPPALLKTYQFFPEVIAAFFDLGSVHYGLWLVALVIAAVVISRDPVHSRRRSEPLLLIAIFSLLCAVSYAERHHLYNEFVAAALLTTISWRAFRSRHPLIRAAAPATVAVILMTAQLTAHFSVLTMVRTTRGPLDPRLVEIWNIPRAQGAWFDPADAARIESIRRFVTSQLAPGETFFDFTNRGLTYYLLNRDCPIRQFEVAFYERPERQAEVIARLQSNPRVRAALVPSGEADATSIDGVSMQRRAPAVWQYLQSHFEPAFQEGDVVFWRRK
jgi:hypothetical protein